MDDLEGDEVGDTPTQESAETALVSFGPEPGTVIARMRTCIESVRISQRISGLSLSSTAK